MKQTSNADAGAVSQMQAFAEKVRDGIADYIADNMADRKHSIAEIDAYIRAIEINADRLAPTAEHAAAPQVGETGPNARYIVIGYGESDYPQAAFANYHHELLDAVLGMIYTKPSDACDETREEYRRDLADEDEWCGKVWCTEFEIGGIVVYDTGAPAASTGEQEAGS